MKSMFSFLIFTLLQGISPSWAQQNLFNVPSSVLTEKQELFIQEQINNYSQFMSSNLTATYGLGKGYEVGLNVLGVDYLKDSRTLKAGSPIGVGIMTNFQKIIPLNEYFRVGVGDQLGANLPSESRPSTQLLYMAYANFVFEDPKSHVQLQMGGYHANRAYRGKGDGFLMMGLDIPMWKRKIHVIADYIGGNTENSVAVLGVSYLPDPNVAISFGYQPKAINSPASEVIEISIFPGRKKKRK